MGEHFTETFSGKFHNELLNVEAFETLLEVQIPAEGFRIETTPQTALVTARPSHYSSSPNSGAKNQPGARGW
jgi:hypothetical protein